MAHRQLLMYVELKSGFSDNGPAWIAYVSTSKSGRTMYFNGRALKNVSRGRYADIETREIFWVSGIKKTGFNRHWAGSGKVLVESRAVPEFLRTIGETVLPLSKYSIFQPVTNIDMEKFHQMENDDVVQEDIDELLSLFNEQTSNLSPQRTPKNGRR